MFRQRVIYNKIRCKILNKNSISWQEIYNEKSLYLINYIRKHIQLIFYIVFMQAYYHVSARHVAMAAGKEC